MLLGLVACGRVDYDAISRSEDGGPADGSNRPPDARALDAPTTDSFPATDALSRDAPGTLDAGEPWLGGALWRRRLTFDHSAGDRPLELFAVPLFLDASRIDYATTGSDGASLRFTAADGITELPYEIEAWAPPGSSLVWVRVPRIEAGSTTDSIFMYWGEPGVSDAQRPADVWDEQFAGVWHADPGWNDSTRNARAGVVRGGATFGPGVLAAAVELDGVDDWVELGDAVDLRVRGGASFTWEAWVRTRDTMQQGTVFRYDDCDGTDGDVVCPPDRAFAFLRTEADESLTFVYGAMGTYASTGSAALPADVWHHVAGVGDAAEGVARVYVDGALVMTAADASPDVYETAGQYLMLGGSLDELWPGAIDEARVSTIARPSAYFFAQWIAGRDAFVSYGPTEPRAGG